MVEGKFLSQIFLQWPTHTSEKFTTAWLAIIYLDYEGASEGLFSGLENSPKQICALEISNLMTLNSFVRFVICSKEHYLVFYSLWQSLSTLATCLSWLNIHSALPCDLVLHLQQHLIPAANKVYNQRWVIVWCARDWNIWRFRNSCIFSDGSMDSQHLLQDVQFSFCSWLRNLSKDFSLSFNQWILNHLWALAFPRTSNFLIICESHVEPIGWTHSSTLVDSWVFMVTRIYSSKKSWYLCICLYLMGYNRILGVHFPGIMLWAVSWVLVQGGIYRKLWVL